jgi:hypothetical protein
MTTTTTRSTKINITPDQADYRGHFLFDSSTGQKKGKTIRRMKPYEIFSLFTANLIQPKMAR